MKTLLILCKELAWIFPIMIIFSSCNFNVCDGRYKRLATLKTCVCVCLGSYVGGFHRMSGTRRRQVKFVEKWRPVLLAPSREPSIKYWTSVRWFRWKFAFLAVDAVTEAVALPPPGVPQVAAFCHASSSLALGILTSPLNVASPSCPTGGGFSFLFADAVTGRVTLPPGDVMECDAFCHASPSRPPVRSLQN